MIFTNLDSIVRRWLLEKKLPIHWYAEGLFHASTCLRELTFDTLQVVNTKRLPVNEYNAVDLPDDFVDEVGVGIIAGQFIRPIPRRDNINPLRVLDADGNFTTYTNKISDADNTEVLVLQGLSWFWNYNEYGEPTGRFFGVDGAAKQNYYTIVRERRQIQLDETFTNESVILQYISDGQSVDAATQIDSQAFYAIQSWITWKSSPNANNNFAPEAQYFLNEKRKLKARVAGLTLEQIKDIIRGNQHGGIKN